MARSDIHRNFWSGGRFGVGVGTQELGGLSGWTCTELELTQLPLILQSHFCPPRFLNKGIFTTWRKKKNNQKNTQMYNLVKSGQITPPWADGASKKSALLGARGKAETAIKGRLPKT